MLQNVANLSLSDTAAEAFRTILKQKNKLDSALRVYVSGGGCCSGVTFGMAIEDQIYDKDITFTSNDVRMVVDEQSIEYLNGATINYVNDPNLGQGFIVENAVQTESGSCGCGNGDSHEGHSHGDGGCACGSGGGHNHEGGGCACGH